MGRGVQIIREMMSLKVVRKVKREVAEQSWRRMLFQTPHMKMSNFNAVFLELFGNFDQGISYDMKIRIRGGL